MCLIFIFKKKTQKTCPKNKNIKKDTKTYQAKQTKTPNANWEFLFV